MSDLEAGYELDEQVALKVMGWHKGDHGWKWRTEDNSPTYYDITDSLILDSDPWHPSTDIAQAWKVVEKLGELGFSTMIQFDRGDVNGDVAGSITKSFLSVHAPFVTGPSAPLAICLAALKAVAAP